MTIKIYVVGAKGGCGKSTISYHLALELSKKYNVLLVDLSASRTISLLFGLTGSLIEGNDYYTESENLGILSFSSYLNSKVDKDIIKTRYYEVIDEKDIVIVDSPIHVEPFLYLEQSISLMRSIVLPIAIPNEMIILATLNYVSNYFSGSVQGPLVVNMAKNPLSGYFTIPFYKDLLFKGFWLVKTPKEIEKLAEIVIHIKESLG
ncbi:MULTISPECIES: ParA family protein [Acidianus]|uniref:CobQ/CobB/MinD/ParA nucleotide binding domain-containing protein n=1 Tax=Candidatus Acidianus copahuensis TaxID=1160895 RepID=A0A031LQQ3_9CREN|nr:MULTISPECIES: ParA family protein [Acidianus]EZQ07090.1 hypothetical protein CM19_04995 [Candidatus Acidianus copahuensis]NON63264.1 ParA family protein [Acidianus sp. RZ1]